MMFDSSRSSAPWSPAVPRTDKVCLFGIPFDRLSMEGVLQQVEARLGSGRRTAISVVNVAKLVNMQRDSFLRESVLAGDIVVADGMPIVWVSRLLRRALPQRVAGIDLMFELFALANRRRWRVFLLGAQQEVLERVAEKARRDYPGAVIAGMQHGYFDPAEDEKIAGAIAVSGSQILFVAMSSPRKERFMNTWSGVMDVPIIHGVGGSFDVMAGKTRRAPRWMQRLGLEWLYRVIQEPRRMWKRYLVTNTLFMLMVLRELFARRSHGTMTPNV